MTIGRRLTIVLKVLAVFVLFGPPIGALTVFLGIGINGAIQSGSPSDVVVLTMFGLIYGVPVSYLIGATPAAISGLILGATAALHHVPGLLFALIVGTVVGVGMAVYAEGGSVPMPGDETAPDYVFSVLLIAACIAATVLCWIIARSTIGKPAQAAVPDGI